MKKKDKRHLGSVSPNFRTCEASATDKTSSRVYECWGEVGAGSQGAEEKLQN